MRIYFDSKKIEATESCPTCGEVSRITPGRPKKGRVTWRHDFNTISLACGHESANTYDEDEFFGYKVELVDNKTRLQTTELPHGATIQNFDASEEYRHSGIRPCCTVCVRLLEGVIYELYIPNRRIDGVWYSGAREEFCSQEHAMQWLEEKYTPHIMRSSPKKCIPTQETKDFWISALRETGEDSEDTIRSGKWLIQLSAQTVDLYWSKIRTAVEQGKLGNAAKVSTSISPYVMKGSPYMVCVYTYDSKDSSDVMRVRQGLRDLILTHIFPSDTRKDEHTSIVGSQELGRANLWGRPTPRQASHETNGSSGQ